MANERSTAARVIERLTPTALEADESVDDLYGDSDSNSNSKYPLEYIKSDISLTLSFIEDVLASPNQARLIEIEKFTKHLEKKVKEAAEFDRSQKEVIEIMQKRLEQCTTPGGRKFYIQYLDKLMGKTLKLDSEKTGDAESRTIPRVGF